MNLGDLYAQYVTKEEKERDRFRLFVSDVGSCPRKVGYRMAGTAKDFQSEQSAFNNQIMWDIAEHLERTLWEALDAEGLGVAYQFEVPIHDRENWGGRGDIIATYHGRRVIEVKSLRSGAFNYEIDYTTHQCQARVYDHYCHDRFELDAAPLLWYVDRGGSNTPIEQEVPITWEQCEWEMDTLEGVRAAVAKFDAVDFPKLDKVLKVRSYGKQILWEPDGRCVYCDYRLTCEPEMSKNCWAKRDNEKSPFIPTKIAQADIMLPFIQAVIDKERRACELI